VTIEDTQIVDPIIVARLDHQSPDSIKLILAKL